MAILRMSQWAVQPGTDPDVVDLGLIVELEVPFFVDGDWRPDRFVMMTWLHANGAVLRRQQAKR